MSILISSEITDFIYQYEKNDDWTITISGANEIALNDYNMINYTNVSEINFGSDITSIMADCCCGMELQKVTIQDSVIEIGPYAFYCTFLNEIKLPKNLSAIGEMAFFFANLSEITIPEKITEIPYQCFCSNELTNITLCGQITCFGEGCFTVNKLTNFTIGSSVRIIEADAFSYNNISSIVIPDTIRYLCDGAFNNNPLTSVSLPASLQLTSNPFYGCQGLTSLDCYDIDFNESLYLRKAGNEIANENNTLVISMTGDQCGSGLEDTQITAIGNYCYAYNTYSRDGGWKLDLSQGKSNIREIGCGAFTFCKELKSINLGNQITRIDEDAFNNCDLTAVEHIPSALNQFSSRLFVRNVKLQSIDIPSNISAIGDYCFGYCSSLMSVIMSGDYDSAPYLSYEVFPDQTTIYVKNNDMLNLFKLDSEWNSYYENGQLSALTT